MAKEKERKLAYILYTEQGLTAKDIAQQVHVSEKTLGEWVTKYKWKKVRTAKLTSQDNLIKGYNELLEALLEKRLEIERGEREESEYKGIVDEISKISKAVEVLRKEGTPSLRMYIYCIDRFSKALHKHNPKLYLELIDFQREHIINMAEELK